MDREGFRNRLKQYKQAREENPGLKYWEWKAQPAEKGIPKYDKGTDGVTLKEKEDAFWRGDTAKMAELVEREGGKLTYVTPESNLDEVVITAKNLKKEKQLKKDYNNVLDLGITAAGFVPGLGEIIDAADIVNQLRQGNYGDAALVGLGLTLPFISGRVLKKGGKYLSDAYHKLYPTLGAPEVSKIHTTPVYHSTRFALPEDLPVAGSELGFHVGTPKAAKERFRKTAGMEEHYPDRITFPHMEEGYIQLIEDKIADVDDLVLFHPSMFEKYNSPGTFYTRDKRIINALKDPISMDDLLDEVGTFRKNLVLNYGVDALRYTNGAEDAGSVSYAILNPNTIKLAKQVQHQYPTHDYLFTNNDKIYPFAEGGEVKEKSIPTQEEYIAEQIDARKASALEKSLSRTMPRVPQGIKTGERWNPVTKKVEDIHECGPSCAYTFSDNYGQNWMSSEDFKQNHANYGWKQVPWEQRQPGNAVLIVDDSGTARHTMMYDSDNVQGQPLFNHSNGGHDESAIRKKAKYPHHNPYLTYEFVGTPADSTRWINDYKKMYGFAEGGEVTGPPTYEDWYKDITKPTLSAFDDVNLKVSMEEASADLHNMAMMLPGYAERWDEYQRSRPKEDPSIDQFVDDLWENENPNNVGYRNGKYYPHKSPEGGKMTIGPGFKLDSGSHGISTKTANRGMTKTRLNQEARRIGKQHLAAVDQFLNYGQTTNPADTVSPQIKMGLMDLRHQVGPLNEWSNLRQAVLEGDPDRIKKESTVTWNDNGKIKVDKRRKKIRDEKYFYYE